jgi:hypothetical protein
MRVDIRTTARMWWMVAGAALGAVLALLLMIWIAAR